MTARCEPPPELRDRDGWHWLQHSIGGSRVVSEWSRATPGWSGHGWWDAVPVGPKGVSPKQMAEWGWTWLAPVPSPTDVTRLVEAARSAQARFAEYAVEHVRKGALEKAERNQTHADALRAAVASFQEPTP